MMAFQMDFFPQKKIKTCIKTLFNNLIEDPKLSSNCVF